MVNYYRLAEIRPHDTYGATLVLSPEGLDSPNAVIIATEVHNYTPETPTQNRRPTPASQTQTIVAHFGEERLRFTTYITDPDREIVLCINTEVIIKLVKKYLTELEGPKKIVVSTQEQELRELWQIPQSSPPSATSA